METNEYIAGTVVTLTFPIDEPTGGPMDLEDLGIRLRIAVLGPDVVITGYATTGEFLREVGGTPFEHPSVAAFDLNPQNMPQKRQTYPAFVEVDDGDGWRTLPGGKIFIDVRSP